MMRKLIDYGIPWEDSSLDNKGVPDSMEEMDGEEFQASDSDIAECESYCRMEDVSSLLDRMVMDIQHLETEVIRARYRLSFHLPPPYDEHLRDEIFSGLGSRYQGNPVYDEYLHFRGFPEYEDAIDTSFHIDRMLRLAKGFDDHHDLYP